MPTESPTQRATALLKLHNGRCSVPHSSPLHRAFAKMAFKGEVQMVSSATPGMVDIISNEQKPA